MDKKERNTNFKVKTKEKFGRAFNFLNVKPAKEKLTEDNLYDFVLRKEYKKNQETVFWCVFISYMVFYFTRKQWTVFGTQMMTDGFITNGQYAMVGLIFAVVYGISKFLSSPLSDTKSNRWLLGLGLIGAGVANLILGVSWINVANGIVAPLVLSCILMVITGWIHSFGATPSVRFFYNWFPNKARRNRIVCWNVSANIGGALSTFVVIWSYNWMGSSIGTMAYFLLPSVISIVIGIFAILLIKDKPEVVGLVPLKEYYNMELIGTKKKIVGEGEGSEENKPFRYFFVKYVLLNKFVWFLAVANLLVYTLRMGMSDWSLKYLKNVHNFDMKEEGKWIYSMFDWGGLVFTLIVGLMANRYLKRFIPLTIGVICVATCALIGVWQIGNNQAGLAVFMLIAGMIFIPQCFLPMMVSEFSHHRVVSTASGVLGISGYMGDALMSKVIIGFGFNPNGAASFNAVFIFLIICGFAAALLLIPMFNKKVSQ